MKGYMDKTINKCKGQRSREKILETAIHLFAQKGFDQTSAQEIADRCKISQTTIFYHFKNKKILFTEVLHYVVAQNRSLFEGKIAAHQDAHSKLINLLKSNIEWAYRYPEQAQIVLILFQFAVTDKEMAILATQTIHRGRSLLEEYLKLMLAEKTLSSPDLNIQSLSVTIQQYIHGAMIQILVSQDKKILYELFMQDIELFIKKTIQ